jgi:hypothetical protein
MTEYLTNSVVQDLCSVMNTYLSDQQISFYCRIWKFIIIIIQNSHRFSVLNQLNPVYIRSTNLFMINFNILTFMKWSLMFHLP